MDVKDLRKKTEEELKKEISQSYLELKNVMEDIRTGKEKNVKKGLKIRKNIARMLTVLNEKESKK